MPLMADNHQKKIIHTIKGAIGLEDGLYREIMFATFGKTTSVKLTYQEAQGFIKVLRNMQADLDEAHGRPNWGWGREKYETLRHRPAEYARPHQLRKVEATWREVARTPTDEALAAFIRNLTGAKGLIWLKQEDVQAVLVALAEMRKARRRREEDGGRQTAGRREAPEAGAPSKAARAGQTEAERAKDSPSVDDASNGPQPVREGSSRPLRKAEKPLRKAPKRPKKNMTQCQKVLWHLENVGPLTPLGAQQEYGIMRLAARVYDLRKKGERIVRHDKTVTNRYGEEVTVASYVLPEGESFQSN